MPNDPLSWLVTGLVAVVFYGVIVIIGYALVQIVRSWGRRADADSSATGRRGPLRSLACSIRRR
jgi:hypothetical protein